MILFEDRAATVLYKVLTNIKHKKFILPLNICPIVPDTFLRANKDFEFCDISLDTLCMDENLLLEKIRNDSNIDGILFVKTFGIQIDIEPLFNKIKLINKNIFIIDDMCPCVQEFDYNIENTNADMILFSSGYSKYIDIGFGGYGFLRDDAFSKVFEDKSRNNSFLKYKETILSQIPLMHKHKEELNNIYKNGLPEFIQLGEKFNIWRFSILIDNKDTILNNIFKVDNLFASSHYPQVDCGYSKNLILNSNTQMVHNRIVNLFNDFRFNKDRANQVVDIINDNLIKG